MRLFLLKRESKAHDYDEPRGFVIRAKDTAQAWELSGVTWKREEWTIEELKVSGKPLVILTDILEA